MTIPLTIFIRQIVVVHHYVLAESLFEVFELLRENIHWLERWIKHTKAVSDQFTYICVDLMSCESLPELYDPLLR